MKTVFDQDICSISTGSVAVIIGSELYCRMTTSVEKKKKTLWLTEIHPLNICDRLIEDTFRSWKSVLEEQYSIALQMFMQSVVTTTLSP